MGYYLRAQAETYSGKDSQHHSLEPRVVYPNATEFVGADTGGTSGATVVSGSNLVGGAELIDHFVNVHGTSK